MHLDLGRAPTISAAIGPRVIAVSQAAMSVSGRMRVHAGQRLEWRVLGTRGGRPGEHRHAVREGDEREVEARRDDRIGARYQTCDRQGIGPRVDRHGAGEGHERADPVPEHRRHRQLVDDAARVGCGSDGVGDPFGVRAQRS